MGTAQRIHEALTDEPVLAERGDPVAEHIRAGLDTRLRAVIKHDPGTRIGTDPEELHQLRVSVRRMRAMLKSGRPFLLRFWWEPLLAELGWLGRALGPVRDLDVLLARLRQEASELPAAERGAAARLISGLEVEHAAARQTMLIELDSDRYTELLATLADSVRVPLPTRDSEVDDRAELIGLVHKQFRKLGEDVERAGSEPSDSQLHASRIRGKRLRYTAELLEGTDQRARRLVRAAKRFQDVLGQHQDACVARQRVRALLHETEDPASVSFVAGRLVERESARRIHYRQQWWTCWRKLRRAAKKL